MYTLVGLELFLLCISFSNSFFYDICSYIFEGEESLVFISHAIFFWLFSVPINTFQLIQNTWYALLFFSTIRKKLCKIWVVSSLNFGLTHLV